MKGRNKRILLNLVVSSLFILQLGINIFSFFQIRHLLDAHQWVSHTYKVINSIGELWNKTLELQSSLRGYLVTGHQFYLNDYKAAQSPISQINNQLKILIQDNPQQDTQLNALINLLKTRLNSNDFIIKTYQEKGEVEAKKIIQKDSNEVLNNRIHQATENMIGREFLLLELRNKSLRDSTLSATRYLKFTIFTTFLLIILFLTIFNLQYSRAIQINQRRKQVEGRLTAVIQGTNDAIAAIDTHYNLIMFNRPFEKAFFHLFGKPVSIGSNIKELLAYLPEEQKKAVDLWGKALQGKKFSIVQEFGDSKFARNSYEITFNAIYDKQGELIGASHIARDVTERLKMETAMEEANKQLTSTLTEIKKHNQALSSLNYLNSTLQSCFTLGETFTPIATYAPKILLSTKGILYLTPPSKNYLELAVSWGDITAQKNTIALEDCWALRRGQIHRFYNKNVTIPCEHIKSYSEPSLCVPLQAQNEDIGLLYLIFSNHVSEEQFNQLVEQQELLITTFAEAISLSLANIKLRETLRLRSIRDPLTGLYNRMYLEESFTRELQQAKRQNTHLAVVMMDLDHFKKINDTYGHEAGDLFLVEVAKLLTRNIRESDIICRYGGEEILLLLNDVKNLEEVHQRVEKLRLAIMQLDLIYNGKNFRVTASFGIAFMPTHGQTPTQLIEAADHALYESKKNGRNRTTFAKN